MASKRRPPRLSVTELQAKRRKRSVWYSFPVAVLVIGAGAYYSFSRPLTHQAKNSQTAVPPAVSRPTAQDTGRTNILLIGTDTRPGETGGNTDVLMLCSIDTVNKRIEMLSIPRDTRIQFPDGTYNKINAALDIGGPSLTLVLVHQLLNVKIDDYALTHFGGLVDVINTIHGITVNVPERMYYNTGDKKWNIINLQPGVQTLNGVQALGFVRFRHDALGDIGRTERQQEFLKALAQKLLRPQNIPQLPTLVQEFSKTVDTNMSLLQVGKLATNAAQFKDYKIIHETLPGSFQNPTPSDPASYWIVNPQQAKYAAHQFFYNGVVQSNPVQTPAYTASWTPPVTKPATSSADQGNISANGVANGATNGTNSTTTTAASSANGTNTTVISSSPNKASVTQTVSSNGGTTMIASSPANIRSGPGTNYSIVGSLTQGQSVTVTGQSGSWDEVSLGSGRIGYVASWLLSQSG